MDLVTQSLPEWATWSTGVLAGSLAIWAWFVKAWPKIESLMHDSRLRRSRAETLRNARILRHLTILLQEWLVKKGAQRALLLHAKNNGKEWPPDMPVKVSCLDQAVGPNDENTWQRWQDWRADPAYRGLLHDVLASYETDRGVLIITETMDAGALRDAYRSQGTVAAVVFAIRWLRENALVYVSLNFGRCPTPGAPLTDQECRSYESAARRLFNDPEAIRRMVSAGRLAWHTNP